MLPCQMLVFRRGTGAGQEAAATGPITTTSSSSRMGGSDHGGGGVAATTTTSTTTTTAAAANRRDSYNDKGAMAEKLALTELLKGKRNCDNPKCPKKANSGVHRCSRCLVVAYCGKREREEEQYNR